MGKRIKTPKIDIEEYHAKVCMNMILEFRDYNTSPVDEDVRISDFNLQDFRNYLQHKIITQI